VNRALTAAAVLLAGLAAACSGSSGGTHTAASSPAATTTSPPASAAPTVTMTANPIVAPTLPPPTSAAPGDVPAGATLVMRHDGSGTSYVVYAEPRNGSYCLVLVAGSQRGEQCVRSVPPSDQLDVHTLSTGTGPGAISLLAGVTGGRVVKVTADTDAGSAASVTPVAVADTGGKAFAVAVDPDTVSQVTAYDAAGNVVARS
jgi:hypothetical protein